jgi:hypothetical protein
MLALSPTLRDLGLLLGAIGGFVVAFGAWQFLHDPSGERANKQRYWTMWGSALIGVSFLVMLIDRLGR